MGFTKRDSPRHIVIENLEVEKGQAEPCGEPAIRLRRWLVSFASGREWYPVGEFATIDATSAIERAIDVFGPAALFLLRRATAAGKSVSP